MASPDFFEKRLYGPDTGTLISPHHNEFNNEDPPEKLIEGPSLSKAGRSVLGACRVGGVEVIKDS